MADLKYESSDDDSSIPHDAEPEQASTDPEHSLGGYDQEDTTQTLLPSCVMLQPAFRGLLTPGQELINQNLVFVSEQLEKLTDILEPGARRVRKEMVPDPQHAVTETGRFLHPTDSGNLSAGEYLIYHNEATLATQMTDALRNAEQFVGSVGGSTKSHSQSRSKPRTREADDEDEEEERPLSRAGSSVVNRGRSGRGRADSRTSSTGRSQSRSTVTSQRGNGYVGTDLQLAENAKELMKANQTTLETAYSDMLTNDLKKVVRVTRGNGSNAIIDARSFFLEHLEPFFEENAWKDYIIRAKKCSNPDLVLEYIKLGKDWKKNNPDETRSGVQAKIPIKKRGIENHGKEQGDSTGRKTKKAKIVPPENHRPGPNSSQPDSGAELVESKGKGRKSQGRGGQSRVLIDTDDEEDGEYRW